MSDNDGLPHNGNPFSVAAAQSLVTIRGAVAIRLRAMNRLLEIDPDGVTADAFEVWVGGRHQSVANRFGELRKDGLVEVRGERPTRTGCKAGVYHLTPLGRSILEKGLYDGTRLITGPPITKKQRLRDALAEALRGWASNTTDPAQLARIEELRQLVK